MSDLWNVFDVKSERGGGMNDSVKRRIMLQSFIEGRLLTNVGNDGEV